MEETMHLREYLNLIKKKFWVIALVTIICTLVSAIISFFVLDPIYEAQTTLIVNSDQPEESVITGDQITVTEKLAITYGEIIKSRVVLESVIESLNLDITYEEMKENIVVSPVSKTQIIQVKVKDTNPKTAKQIANQIPIEFTEEVQRITKANSVEVIDKAIEPIIPVKPNKIMNIALSAILGITISLFAIFLIDFLDNKIQTPEDVEKYLQLPLLGTITNEKETK